MAENGNKVRILTGLILGLMACNKPSTEHALKQPSFGPIYLEFKPQTARKVDSVLAGRRVSNATLSETDPDSITDHSLSMLTLGIQHGKNTYQSELDSKSNRLLRLKQGDVPVTFFSEFFFYQPDQIDTIYHPHMNFDYIDFYIALNGDLIRIKDWDKDTRAK